MKKIVLIVFISSLILGIYFSGIYRLITFENIKTNLELIKEYYASNPLAFTAQFVGVYVLITSLSIPGAIVLTLLSGAIFGVVTGTLIVGLASTTGATIAFLYSRYIFRDFFRERFKDKLHNFDKRFKEEGNRYFFSIRMVPVSPFVVINILMGLTPIKLWNYIWITFVGMFPGTLVYVYAGRKMSQLDSPSEILTFPILILLTTIAFLPFLFKKLMQLIQGHRKVVY